MNAEPNTKNAEARADVEAGAGAPTPETVAGETAPAADPPAEPVARDDDRVAALEAEVAGLKDQVLRSMAETENIRRRGERDREETAKYAVAKFATELVAVADNLQRALEAVSAEARASDEALNNLMVGVEATERQLAAAFDRFGVKRMESLGKPFDPNFHQVVFEVPATGKPAGTVVQVLQEGYVIHDRLLREAMVGVSKADAEGQGHVDTTA
ncbi:MAG TPA: nucleotide exchange factor GrpE, partial [Arenibaculum sp.]|nr:nucleotide exchange factor GrpE [Arenibaculum sp.]